MNNIPKFGELSAKKQWPYFKKDKSRVDHMPDYAEDQLPEREHFIGVISTLYPGKVEELVKKAYKVRHEHYMPDVQDSILMHKSIKEQIDKVLSYRSKSNKLNYKFSDK